MDTITGSLMATNRRSFWHYTAIGLVFWAACAFAQTPSAPAPTASAATDLKRLVAADPELKRLLIASIERARQVNPDRKTNPVQSLDEYYEYIAWVERALPGDLLKI